jgi:hypothetical protein
MIDPEGIDGNCFLRGKIFPISWISQIRESMCYFPRLLQRRSTNKHLESIVGYGILGEELPALQLLFFYPEGNIVEELLLPPVGRFLELTENFLSQCAEHFLFFHEIDEITL